MEIQNLAKGFGCIPDAEDMPKIRIAFGRVNRIGGYCRSLVWRAHLARDFKDGTPVPTFAKFAGGIKAARLPSRLKTAFPKGC